jgi:hypothetical protein
MKYTIEFEVSGKSAEAAWERFCQELNPFGPGANFLATLREVAAPNAPVHSGQAWRVDQAGNLVPLG